MENKNLVQIFFDDVMCFVDIENKEIYSAKLHKLKGQKLRDHLYPHFMIKYNCHKRYMSLDNLINLALQKKAQ